MKCQQNIPYQKNGYISNLNSVSKYLELPFISTLILLYATKHLIIHIMLIKIIKELIIIIIVMNDLI